MALSKDKEEEIRRRRRYYETMLDTLEEDTIHDVAGYLGLSPETVRRVWDREAYR